MIFSTFFKTTKDAWIERIKSAKSIISIGGSEKYTISDLENHKVFSKLDRFKKYNKRFLTHGEYDETKTKAFKVFLDSKLESTKDCIKYIIKHSNNKMSRLELRNLIDTAFLNHDKELEQKMILKFTGDGLSKLNTAMLVDKFFSIRELAMDKYSDAFDDVFSTPTFDDNKHILNVIFFLIHIESQDIVEACVEAFESVNGIFKDIEY